MRLHTARPATIAIDTTSSGMSGGAVHGKRRRTSAAPTHGAGRQTIPPFLTALWDMVDSPENVNLISWSQEGRSFVVHDPNGLEEVRRD